MNPQGHLDRLIEYFGKRLTDGQTREYLRCLYQLPEKSLTAAVDRIIDRFAKFPSVKDLRDVVNEIEREVRESEAYDRREEERRNRVSIQQSLSDPDGSVNYLWQVRGRLILKKMEAWGTRRFTPEQELTLIDDCVGELDVSGIHPPKPVNAVNFQKWLREMERKSNITATVAL